MKAKLSGIFQLCYARFGDVSGMVMVESKFQEVMCHILQVTVT